MAFVRTDRDSIKANEDEVLPRFILSLPLVQRKPKPPHPLPTRCIIGFARVSCTPKAEVTNRKSDLKIPTSVWTRDAKGMNLFVLTLEWVLGLRETPAIAS